jgi:hypothetical protein
LIFASWMNDVYQAGAGTDDRLQVNGVTAPSDWSWVQSPVPNKTSYDGSEIFYNNVSALVSIPSTGQSIALDAMEMVGGSQLADEVSMTVFSTVVFDDISGTAYEQKKSDNTSITAGGWSDDDDMKFVAVASNIGSVARDIDFYFEIATSGTAFTTATTTPSGACVTATAYGSCESGLFQKILLQP